MVIITKFIKIHFYLIIMGAIGKLFAFVMFPLSILIILDELDIYSLLLPINMVIFGAVLMIILEIITIAMLFFTYGKPSVMNVITALIFILTAVTAIGSGVFGFFEKEISVILGVMMFVSALYALH
jgi:hypothetical protein